MSYQQAALLALGSYLYFSALLLLLCTNRLPQIFPFRQQPWSPGLGLVSPWTLAWMILWLKAASRAAMGRRAEKGMGTLEED